MGKVKLDKAIDNFLEVLFKELYIPQIVDRLSKILNKITKEREN